MSNPNPSVNWYFQKSKSWTDEKKALRQIVLASDLTEQLKWGHPCYALNGANVVLIHAFKDYCALLFHKGALMDDPDKILIQQTENVQSARQIRFTSATQIKMMTKSLTDYLKNAIDVEKAGRKVALKEPRDYPFPPELLNKLDADPDLAAAFHALTPGRQKGYSLYLNAAKQAKTREMRVDKSIPKILAGKGPDDP